ncbi:tRNA lysidine(34) synthetase TilS [Adhaeribacter rhizoryzae]|uniref:tRNA(Ile)-lysidine synthase n=1 Tax=Adhaeribacter rhizoryzae TaxID=2607907 RepID=A0A5M6DGU3_9BACT|nr:tRNA lysidine(34) synthetase TilS [Adhaeribacter rhizoryzae]KAA5546633.1 tRNA lysidine(34) synthetase TilS [Adhaeribacter rhizoryzae]
MINKVLAYAEQHALFTLTDKIIATVSGGIDSVVLCDILYKLKISFCVAHANFGLRAEESDADEIFVKKLAKKYNVPFYSEQFNTLEFAQQEKISTQMAARTLRYNWFEQLRQQLGYNYVATAHHQNDAAETILLNLTKGTGIAGLHGIAAKKAYLIRPLLCLTKDDIYEYVTENQLIWREDSSNESTKYQRNLIRHEVIPVLKNINPSLETTLNQTVEKIQGAEQIYLAYINEIKTKALRQEAGVTYLNLTPLREALALPVVLFELLRDYNFNYENTRAILETFEGISGKTFQSATHVLVKDRDQLVITSKDLRVYGSFEINLADEYFDQNGLKLKIHQLPAENYKIPRSRNIAALDLNLLQFPLKIRPWKEGDWFVPLGMNGKKKLSDFFINEKIPVNLKAKIMVLTSDKSVVWIIGHRLDNRFKVTDKTEQVLELEVQQ